METGLISKRPGDDIDSWCGKCKLVLAHTIEAIDGDKIARVSCNTCRSQHSYKPHPPGESRTAGKRADGTPRKSARTGVSRYQSLLNARATAVVKGYSPNSTYAEGDVLEHPTFGRGAVTAVREGTKIEVLFEAGPKTLIQARAEGTPAIIQNGG